MAGKKALDGSLQKIIEDSEMFDEALNELERVSLIDRQRIQFDERIKIHRLIQQVIRDELDEKQRNSLCNSVINLCNVAFPQTYNWKTDTISICRKYQDQVLEPLLEISEMKSDTLLDILDRIG